MLDIARIGFALAVLGVLLLLISAWVLVHQHAGRVRDLARPVFAMAGLLVIGGAVVFWVGVLR